MAGGSTWHPQCFVCTHCRQPLESKFVEFDGVPYCKADYLELFAMRCAQCQLPIEGKRVQAVGQCFHRDCFVCQACGKALAGQAFFQVNGKAICGKECAKGM